MKNKILFSSILLMASICSLLAEQVLVKEINFSEPIELQKTQSVEVTRSEADGTDIKKIQNEFRFPIDEISNKSFTLTFDVIIKSIRHYAFFELGVDNGSKFQRISFKTSKNDNNQNVSFKLQRAPGYSARNLPQYFGIKKGYYLYKVEYSAERDAARFAVVNQETDETYQTDWYNLSGNFKYDSIFIILNNTPHSIAKYDEEMGALYFHSDAMKEKSGYTIDGWINNISLYMDKE